jgi:hypothetical protein
MLDKMETGRGHLGESVKHSEGKGGESVVVILMFLCGSSHMCRLRTEWLVPLSKYWTYRSHAGDMGPVSLVACHQQVFDLSALLKWLCWERNWGESRGPLSQAERWSRKHFFSGPVHLSNPIDDSRKVVTYRDRPQETYAGYAWTGVGSVYVIRFSPVRCTSIRIVATLGYE